MTTRDAASRRVAGGSTDRVQADAAAPPRPSVVESWPQGVSREPSMRISDVLAELQPDFPALSPSKLRFLEEQGLVEPRRTAGGYRQYSRADVERVRYVLRQQRDRYLPLRVIGEQLAALDRGEGSEQVVPRLATSDGEPLRAAGRHTVESLAREAGVDPALVTGLVEAGVVTPGAGGHLDPWAMEIVIAAAALAEHGVEPRHLRGFRSAADRQVDVVDQIVAPLRGQRQVAAQAHAAAVAAEVGELCSRLHTALVRAGVARLSP
ncbi:MerR family transcriptional regulator [Actinotalea sp. M2MS4P-6]|uniref:transcriptional regulator FtsR n=1 Tax=Actinotalea sp. M2MS4P-6 TaxID=2983762 RepID=UPI0021E478D6|nr:MerR family transcriptional regulator [Actinotalea sp. M2MS4P-6]MCV2394629.1 MerR family transcriptional regulator [Actinotalea sp. M2MS4P-6]